MDSMKEMSLGRGWSPLMCGLLGAAQILATSSLAMAQQTSARGAEEGDQLWASLFGEGMRAWAESDYEAALDSLYQAHALKPTAYNLGLIIRSHDFLGQCRAAIKQREEYASLYDERDRPVLQRCAVVSTLEVTCPVGHARLEVWIDGSRAGRCGEALLVSAGEEREVSLPQVQYSVTLKLEPSKQRVHTVTLSAHEKRPHVSKLLGTADRYTVFMTPDGLYQIWVLSDEALLDPYEGSFCMKAEEEQGRAQGKASCKPLTKKQRDELEKVAPRVLLLPE